MRNKAPLALEEQLVMLLVFALTAALCLKCFVWGEEAADAGARRDAAALCAQNAAEILKYARGDLALAAAETGWVEDGAWQVCYDESWHPVQTGGDYLLRARILEEDIPLLGSAEVSVLDANGRVLCALPVRWQEVSP